MSRSKAMNNLTKPGDEIPRDKYPAIASRGVADESPTTFIARRLSIASSGVLAARSGGEIPMGWCLTPAEVLADD